MREEIHALAIELAEELITFPADKINELRTEFLKSVRSEAVADFINYICDFAIHIVSEKIA